MRRPKFPNDSGEPTKDWLRQWAYSDAVSDLRRSRLAAVRLFQFGYEVDEQCPKCGSLIEVEGREASSLWVTKWVTKCGCGACSGIYRMRLGYFPRDSGDGKPPTKDWVRRWAYGDGDSDLQRSVLAAIRLAQFGYEADEKCPNCGSLIEVEEQDSGSTWVTKCGCGACSTMFRSMS